nr:C2 calcium/lipid-binding domain, CaLB [Tanacetum cinerariifolium]
KIEVDEDNSKVKWDPNDLEFKNWLTLKFRNNKTIDEYSKNALWDYWKRGDNEEVKTDNELSNPIDDDLIEENEIA